MPEDGDLDNSKPSSYYKDSYDSWITTQLNKGTLTQRDVAWVQKEPSSLLEYYGVRLTSGIVWLSLFISNQIAGAVIGFMSAGLASRLALRSTLRPWSFSRTMFTAGASAGAGYLLAGTLQQRSITRFNRDNDNPTTAMIARYKRSAIELKEQVLADIANAKRNQKLDYVLLYEKALVALEEAERRFMEDVVLGVFLLLLGL